MHSYCLTTSMVSWSSCCYVNSMKVGLSLTWLSLITIPLRSSMKGIGIFSIYGLEKDRFSNSPCLYFAFTDHNEGQPDALRFIARRCCHQWISNRLQTNLWVDATLSALILDDLEPRRLYPSTNTDPKTVGPMHGALTAGLWSRQWMWAKSSYKCMGGRIQGVIVRKWNAILAQQRQ